MAGIGQIPLPGHSSSLWSFYFNTYHDTATVLNKKKLQLCLLNLTAFKEAVAKYTIRVKSDLLQMGLNKELHPHMYKASSSVWTKTKTLHCHSANVKVYRKLSKAKFKSKIFWYKSFKLAFFSRQKKYLMKIAPAYTFL